MISKTYVYWLHLPEHIDIFTEGYVGVTINPQKRFQSHLNRAKKGTHRNSHLSNALRKYDIIQTIILIGTEEYCYEIEGKLRPGLNIGWNASEGGMGGSRYIRTKEWKENKSLIMKGNCIGKGHKGYSPLGKRGPQKNPDKRGPMSVERKKNMRGYVGPGMLDETKKRMSEVRKQYWIRRKALENGS